MKKETVRTGAALAVSVLLALICALIVYKGAGFIYAIADDVIMRDIASGAFTGTPDGHLIFIRYVLGFCISRLYMLNRTVDWYGFFMVGALFLGLAAVICTAVFQEKRHFAGKRFTPAWRQEYSAILWPFMRRSLNGRSVRLWWELQPFIFMRQGKKPPFWKIFLCGSFFFLHLLYQNRCIFYGDAGVWNCFSLENSEKRRRETLH